jgi:hypothetical protein
VRSGSKIRAFLLAYSKDSWIRWRSIIEQYILYAGIFISSDEDGKICSIPRKWK